MAEDDTLPSSITIASEPETFLVSGMTEATAAERLYVFEVQKLGPDAVRINGQIERGHGSKFRDLSEEDQAKYAALEKLVEAEQKLGGATKLHLQAENDYEAALAAVDKFDNPAPEPEAPADA